MVIRCIEVADISRLRCNSVISQNLAILSYVYHYIVHFTTHLLLKTTHFKVQIWPLKVSVCLYFLCNYLSVCLTLNCFYWRKMFLAAMMLYTRPRIAVGVGDGVGVGVGVNHFIFTRKRLCGISSNFACASIILLINYSQSVKKNWNFSLGYFYVFLLPNLWT